MTDQNRPIRLYRHALSGHSHRVELFLSLLGLSADRVDVDLASGAHKSSQFLAKNPFGQVPVLEDGDVTLSDSNAILVYLALAYDRSGTWYPADPAVAGQIQRWLSIAAGQLASGPAAARLVTVFKAPLDHDRCKAIANALFSVLETHLAATRFLAGKDPTIADVAVYSYAAHAPEGGVALDGYANLRAWIGRVEALPGFVPMQRTPLADAA